MYMDERNASDLPERQPHEVVETYRRPIAAEQVSVYRRPLPGVQTPSAEPPKKKKRSRRGLLIFLGCLALVAVLAAAAFLLEQRAVWSREFSRDGRTEQSSSDEITIPTWPIGQGASLEVLSEHGEAMTAQAIYRQVNPAVVTVMVDLGDSISVGTGVIFTSDGYILTNYHVVEGGEECLVALDTGESDSAMYVAGDEDNDLAILKVEGQDLPTAEFGNSDLLSVGDKVYAIGNPLGVELRGTLTDGIVSAINRDVTVDGRTMTLIQTNAALNSGNSGGPLINEYGQVVGINVIKMTSSYSNVEGLGFAIPASSMWRIVNDLLTYGELQPEPLLGIMVMASATQLTADFAGLEIQEVTEGSAADLAGVQAGDYVVRADGELLQSSQDLLRVRQRFHLGDQMTMTLWRDGGLLEVTLTLTEAVESA
jgi:serine protease Do